MARQVKCVYCSEKGSSDDYYKVSVNVENTRFKYYCSKEEYELFKKNEEDKLAEKEALYLERKEQEELKKRETALYKDLMTYVVEELLEYEVGMNYPVFLAKRVKALKEFYTYQMIKESFYRNREVITWAIKNKGFSTEFNMSSYVMAIVEGSINDVYKEWKAKEQMEKKAEASTVDVSTMNDIDMETVPVVKKKEKASILSFLEEDEM